MDSKTSTLELDENTFAACLQLALGNDADHPVLRNRRNGCWTIPYKAWKNIYVVATLLADEAKICGPLKLRFSFKVKSAIGCLAKVFSAWANVGNPSIRLEIDRFWSSRVHLLVDLAGVASSLPSPLDQILSITCIRKLDLFRADPNRATVEFTLGD